MGTRHEWSPVTDYTSVVRVLSRPRNLPDRRVHGLRGRQPSSKVPSAPLHAHEPGGDGVQTLSRSRYETTALRPATDNCLARGSATQQWMPRLPLKTHRMWSNPKSSRKRDYKGSHRRPALPLRAAWMILTATAMNLQHLRQTFLPLREGWQHCEPPKVLLAARANLVVVRHVDVKDKLALNGSKV